MTAQLKAGEGFRCRPGTGSRGKKNGQFLAHADFAEDNMNFNEAYIANSERRVRMTNQTTYWEIGQMRKRETKKKGRCKWEDEYVFAEWEAEPVTIEFSCVWVRREILIDKIPHDIIFPDGFDTSLLDQLLNKKTEVTVKILE